MGQSFEKPKTVIAEPDTPLVQTPERQINQSSKSTDDNRINKYFHDADQALVKRTGGLSRSMGNRSTSQASFIGENATPGAKLNSLFNGCANKSTGGGRRSERLIGKLT